MNAIQAKPQVSPGDHWHFSRLAKVLSSLFIVIVLVIALLIHFGVARADGVLLVEVLAPYNLVVDSNVSSPSTRAPSAATIAGKFCNTGDQDLTNVWGYIGDFTAGTPGVYPSRSTDPDFLNEHPALDAPATYAFTHMGGQLGTADGARFMGTLRPGECRVQYWHLTYPQCETSDTPPCDAGLDPVWGDSVKPDDDLWLELDIWGTSDQSNDNQSWTMTMRNEISAMANKIEPNPDGQWFNTQSSVVAPGDVITSNGIWYEFGNVNKGFDNDGDFVYDYNAWAQPVGDAGYDPTCFRLVRTTGVLTVSRSAAPDMIIPFTDQLYFTNLPADNTGVVGEIHYTFLALGGICTANLSPYQEVASGADNEKFNSDYGTGVPPLLSSLPEVTIDKSSDPDVVPVGTTTTYQIPFVNTGDADAGLALSSGYGVVMPLVISDTVPVGLEYVGGTASYSLGYTPNSGVTIYYSIDGGTNWSTTDPGDRVSQTGAEVIIQWWLNDPLPAGSTTGNYAQFSVLVPDGYVGDSFIENCADSRFGPNSPAFDEACDLIMVPGTNSIGDYVWRDENNNGLQDESGTGIEGVTVSLYWDRNGDGAFDSGDALIGTQGTGVNGGYDFTQLPDANYLVLVDTDDPDLPDGYRETTPTIYAVDLNDPGDIDFNDADFGFGPVLRVDKNLTSSDPAYEGDLVTYSIRLINTRPGDGTAQGACSYYVWAAAEGPNSGTNKVWELPTNALGVGGPDDSYAYADYGEGANNTLSGTDYSIGDKDGAIVKVEGIFQIYLDQPLSNDRAIGTLYLSGASRGSTTFSTAQLDSYVPAANVGLLSWDVTSLHPGTWTFADFTTTNPELSFQLEKVGGPDPALVYLDALGFRITTDQTCGDGSDTIAILPLTDTYDADLLEFVSADPTATSVVTSGSPPSTVGTISWSNLGPLYAGQTKIVNVVFRALEPLDTDFDGENDAAIITNCSGTTGALFADGDPVNAANDCVDSDLYPTGTIGDTVWNDTSGNGVQDGGEVGIPGVTVRLQLQIGNNQWEEVATAVTDEDGEYLFTGLRDGTYRVIVDTATLPGSTFTQTGDPDTTLDNQGTTTINNNNGDPNDDDDLTMDFGYQVPNTIYGNVWEDNDGDGFWESGENGFPGITVYLDDCGVDSVCGNGDDGPTVSTTTDANGYYVFSDLVDGDYRVRVDTTTLPAGGTWSNTVDPEGSPGDNESDTISVAGGNIYGPYDFGYHRSGDYGVGDTLYVDWDGDATQDPGEEGIPNVTISLYQDEDGDGVIDPATDGLIATATTDASGYYTFTALAAQSYIVVVDESDPDFPNGYVQTQDPDEDPGVCSTCDGRGSATLGPSDDTVDFGYQPTGAGSIGDYVWQDDDGDRVQDPGESGLPNITVSLYEDSNNDGVIDSGDALIATTTTDANGGYLFTDLPAGDYLVDVDTSDTDLPTDGSGSPYVLSTANDPHDVTLAAGQDYREADFGFTAGGLIGDFVWQDNDGDGAQDLGEPGISGVTVSLYIDVNGNGVYDSGIDTQYGSGVTTDASGYYTFTSLPAGDYVVVVTPPADYVLTGDPDSYATPCPATGCDSQSGVTLSGGQIDRSHDFGYRPPGVLGDYVWFDVDGDGVQDPEENGIAGVTVELRDGSCAPGADCPTAVTDSDGYYSFGDLSDGTYTVVVDASTLPAGLAQTYDPDDTLDHQTTAVISGGSVSTMGGTSCSDCDYDADFGYQLDGDHSISGTVFYDGGGLTDGTDDVYGDTGDVAYSGITVYLWGDDGLIGTTATDANGFYSFADLPDGTYTVTVNVNSPGLVGMALTAAGIYEVENYHTVTISGAPVSDVDWGFFHEWDFGDLPATYRVTLLADNGPYHITSTLRLGTSVSADDDGQEDGVAEGDDDDGVTRDMADFWLPGAQVNLIITTTGGTGRLAMWINWNADNDTDLSDPGEFVDLGNVVAGAGQVLTLTIPSGYAAGTDLYVRFRLFDPTALPGGSLDAADYLGSADNGEVEDYFWQFGPTAVGSHGLDVRPDQTWELGAWLMPLALLLLMAASALVARRRRTADVPVRHDGG